MCYDNFRTLQLPKYPYIDKKIIEIVNLENDTSSKLFSKKYYVRKRN